jgi:hypothetical protein
MPSSAGAPGPSEPDDGWQHNGLHRYRIEAKDLVVSQPVGTISRDELGRTLDVLESCAQAGPVFWIVDLSKLGSVEPSARRLLAERDAASLLRAIVLTGGSFAQRTLATLSIRAVRLFWRHEKHVPFVIVSDWNAVRAWVEAARRGDMQGCL